MSKQVDQRVVEMRFDNQQFESGVKTTMSTLERLKQGLNLKGAAKGLESISGAAKNVDLSGIDKGIQTVQARFSSLQVIGVTALANITNSAIQAGKNLVSSFTIDPIIQGFREYETQLNSVQTILANTQHEGTNIEQVTAALDELNTYADQTIYNFTEMTRNIGTFTAAGVSLDKSVTAIKGISNLAAVSGSSAQQASTAMYQLSQALAAGRVSLMDWNSVVNAGMGGKVFQDALKRTATQMGYNVDALIEKYGSFRESLTRGQWLTAEVLTETLTQLSGAYTESDLIAQGYSKDQAKAIVELANTATDAATKVKTFTQLIDTLKEAAGSGWAKTFQLILGDFEEAKEFFTGLSDYLGSMINASSDARNSLIEGAMSSNWSKLTKKVEEAGVPLDDFTKKLREVAKEQGNTVEDMLNQGKSWEQIASSGAISTNMVVEALKRMAGASTATGQSTEELNAKLKKFQGVVHDVWMGDYKNGQERVEALTKAGYNYAEVQDLVNKTVNDHKLDLEDLSDSQLKAVGYTEEEIKALRELADQAEKTGTPLNELINNLNKPSGRELFLDTITNFLKAVIEPLRAVASAFGQVFGMSSDQLYGMIDALHSFSEAIVMDPESLDKLTRTLKGLFGVVKIFTTFIGGAFGLAFRGVTVLLDNFNLHILDVTAFIGDLLYAFSDWITSGRIFFDTFDGIVGLLGGSKGKIEDFFESFKQLEVVQNATKVISQFYEKVVGYFSELSKMDPGEALKKLGQDVKSFIKNVKAHFSSLSWEDILDNLTNFGDNAREVFLNLQEKIKEVAPNIIEGLKNGLSDNIQNVIDFMTDLGTKIIEAIKAVLGIHSPSTVMYEIGQNIVQGLINGIQSLIDNVAGLFGGLGSSIKDVLSGIDWGSVLTVAMAGGLFVTLYKLTDAFQMFGTAAKNVTAPMASAGKVLDSVSYAIDEFTGKEKGGTKLQNIATAVKTFAIAIAILAGSVALLSAIDTGKLFTAVGAIAALALILGLLAAALNKFGDGVNAMDTLKINTIIISFAFSMGLLAVAAKVISTIDQNGLLKAGAVLAVFTGVIVALTLVSTKAGPQIDKVPALMTKLSLSFLLLGVAAKIMGSLSEKEMTNGALVLGAFAGVITGLIFATKLAGKGIAGAPALISSVAGAFILLGVAAKIMGSLSEDEMNRASDVLGAFTLVVMGLMAATKLLGKAKSIKSMSSMLIAVTGSMALLGISMKLLGSTSDAEIQQGLKAIGALTLVIVAMIAATKLAPKGEIAKISTTLLAMSISVGILAGVSVLLGMVKTENLVKGIAAVGALSLMVSLMAKATKGANDVKGTMMGMAVAIGVMAASIAVLSFIDPSKLAGATAALSVVIGMFTLLTKAAGTISGGMGTIIVLTAAIAAIGAVLYLLAGLPIEGTLAAATSLSSVMLAMAASLKIISTVKKVSSGALAGMLVLTGVMAAIAAVLGVMDAMDVQASIPTALAISTLLLAMSAACVILGLVPAVSPMALAAIAILTVIVAALAAILGLMSALNIQAALPNALALSTLLLAMSTATAILGVAGLLGPAAISGALSMVGVMGIITALVLAAGAIKQIPGVDWLMSEGSAFMQQLGSAIGGFVGSIVGSAISGITSSLPDIGTKLSEFMNNLKPFLDGVSGIDESKVTAVSSIGGMILALTASNVLEGINRLFGGESSLEKFGSQLVPFGQAMKQYSDTISGINAGAVEASATAAKALAELNNDLPNIGGVIGFFTGEKLDLGTFGSQIAAFGVGLRDYSNSVSGVNAEAITNSANAAKGLVDLQSNLGTEGGFISWIIGQKDNLKSFGESLQSFGSSLLGYSNNIIGINPEAIANSVTAGTSLATLSTTEYGDSQNMVLFGKNLEWFGAYLSSYYNRVSYINPGLLAGIITQINSLVGMAKGMVGLDTSGMTGFGAALESMGNTGIDGLISSFTGAVPRVQAAAGQLIAAAANGARANTGLFQTAFVTVLNLCVQTINSRRSQFQFSGQYLMTALITGIRHNSTNVSRAFTTNLGDAVSSIRNYYKQFYDAGNYLVQGFAKGINDNSWKARDKAKEMARKAKDAANAELRVASPSKEFYKIGKFVVLGFANAVSDNTRLAANSTGSMAKAALNNTKNVISKIADAVESKIDAQPTIRPVLDLSNVEAGASKLNTMLSSSRAMSINNDINGSVASEIQNGVENAPNNGSTFNFTQNNYSPKSLSRIDIYRQTKNQFSSFERMVNA